MFYNLNLRARDIACITKIMPIQYTAIFHGCKNDNFQLKFFDYFQFLLKTYNVGTR